MKKGLFCLVMAALMMPFIAKAQENAPINVVVDTTACNSFTWAVNNETYTEDALVAHRSGDTLFILNLTMDYDKTYTVPGDVNGGCTYTWGTTVYSNPGTHSQHFQTVAGHCDSLVTINLVLDTISTKTYTQSACASYRWHDSTYTESTTTTQTIHSAGCDSILTLNLTIIEPTQIDKDTLVTACNKVNFQFSRGFPKKFIVAEEDTVITSEYFVLYGQASDTANWSSFHHRTIEQCFDSIVTAYITVNHSSYSNSSVTSCDSYTFTVGEPESEDYAEYVYTASKIDTVKLGKNIDNCDSNIILNLTINKSPIVTIYGDFDVSPNNGSTVLYAKSDMSGVRYTWEAECAHNVSGSLGDTISLSNITGNIDVTAIATKTSTGCQGYGRITVLANVGIENAENANVNIYPNPTTSYLHVDCAEPISNIAIFNALGQRVMISNEQASQVVLDLNNLVKGSYSMRIELQNGKVVNRNFIVTK